MQIVGFCLVCLVFVHEMRNMYYNNSSQQQIMKRAHWIIAQFNSTGCHKLHVRIKSFKEFSCSMNEVWLHKVN